MIETTADLTKVEVVLYIDSDDVESRKLSDDIVSTFVIVGPPGQAMGKMNAACYEASRGRYVMLINDDAVFRTPRWDVRLVDAFSRFRDGIVLVYGNDLDQGKAVPTFPTVSRRVCNVLGEICPRGYRNLHIESHLFDIFRQLARLGHNRIVYIDDVVFEHMHPVVGKASLDDTYKKKNQRGDDLLFIELDDERRLQAYLLAQYIQAREKESKNEVGKSLDLRNPGVADLLKRLFITLTGRSS